MPFDVYKTISTASEGIFRDKGSKFIAYAYPILSDEEVKVILQKLHLKHPKARHFCWAMCLSPDRSIFSIQDDGEPSGTAGRQILNVMRSAGLTNILIVVVRYFGGTLLGVPGLINAYKSAAAEAIKESNFIEKTVNDIYEITFDYLAINDIMHLLKDEQLNVLSQHFDNSCYIKLEIRKANVNAVLNKFEKIAHVNLKYLFTA